MHFQNQKIIIAAFYEIYNRFLFSNQCKKEKKNLKSTLLIKLFYMYLFDMRPYFWLLFLIYMI